MTPEQAHEIAREARAHAINLRADIKHAMTRIEMIRLTSLAIEADHLADAAERYANAPEIDIDAIYEEDAVQTAEQLRQAHSL